MTSRKSVFVGQEVAAAIDIKVRNNRFVSIDASSMLKKPENCEVPAGTHGYVERVEEARILVKFYPGTVNMTALWFDTVILATQLRLLDAVYGKP